MQIFLLVEATPKQEWFEALSMVTKSSDRKSDGTTNVTVPLDAMQWSKLVNKWQVRRYSWFGCLRWGGDWVCSIG